MVSLSIAAVGSGENVRKALTVEFKRKAIKVVEDKTKRTRLTSKKKFDITPTTLVTIIKIVSQGEIGRSKGGLPRQCNMAKT